jgi:hypothetical protein
VTVSAPEVSAKLQEELSVRLFRALLIGIGSINDVIFDSASIHPALPQRSRDSYRSGRAPP